MAQLHSEILQPHGLSIQAIAVGSTSGLGSKTLPRNRSLTACHTCASGVHGQAAFRGTLKCKLAACPIWREYISAESVVSLPHFERVLTEYASTTPASPVRFGPD